MERLSYKGGCGVHECTRIEMFKKELGSTINGFGLLLIKRYLKQLYH